MGLLVAKGERADRMLFGWGSGAANWVLDGLQWKISWVLAISYFDAISFTHSRHPGYRHPLVQLSARS